MLREETKLSALTREELLKRQTWNLVLTLALLLLAALS